MAIFKVSRHDKPSVKKLVKAESMTELMDAARVKLSLTEKAYKIFMEDFTEIDDDEILQELATSSKEQLLLTLVPDGIEWNSDISAKSTLTVSKEKPETNSQPCQPSLSQTSDLDNIYVKLPSSVQKSLRTGKFLNYDEKKALVHVIENFMSNDLKNITRGAAIDIGKEIVNTYPNSFTLKNLSTDAAGASLGQKIYDRINYVKQDNNETVSKLCTLLDLENPTRKPKAQDEYGCVAYSPELPPSETWEFQEKKRLELNENYESSKPVDEILQYMSDTYYLQRKHINREQRNLSKFFIDWPYFAHYKIIIAHANHLLGKDDSLETWQNSLRDLYVPINCFLRNKEICAVEKFKKKNKGKNIPDELKYVHHELKEAKEYCNTLNNKVPYQNILFDLITKYMGAKEKLEFLYVIIKEDATDEELLELVEVVNPVLIIRGKDIHDSSSKYDVVIERKIIIGVKSFLDGILITFLSYFIFGFVYPPEIEGTLEVIQRLFLKINPTRGTKRGGKRKAVVQHPKYTNFIEEIDAFKSDDISDL